MTIRLDRRTMLKATAGTAGLVALGGMPALAQDAVRFRLYWWGSQERADRTLEVMALYQEKNPNVTIDGESLSWADYWPRLATQAAGRNAPDLIQMDYRYVAEYARRGALAPLDEFLGKSLTIGDFDQASLDSCRVDGELYGINLGNNPNALMYNKAAFEKAGVPEPEPGLTWDEFTERAVEITKAHDGQYFGTADGSIEEVAFENWLRQRGKALYTADGELGLDETDASDWFAMWSKMREMKACPPADVQAMDKNDIETSMLTQGRAACSFNHSNQYVAFQAVNPNPLGISMYPQGAGPNPGHYLKPSMMWSIYARSDVKEEAVKFANFTVKDPEAATILGVERGVPASPEIQEAVAAGLDELGKEVIAYIAMVSDRVGPLPPAPPKGAGEIQVLLRRIGEQVGFGRLSVAEAGEQYVGEARSILSRN